jgi:hypothetical protein
MCPEVPMWVWTDELVNRVDPMGRIELQRVPLMAYAVDDEADLEALAREMFEIKTEENPSSDRGEGPFRQTVRTLELS